MPAAGGSGVAAAAAAVAGDFTYDPLRDTNFEWAAAYACKAAALARQYPAGPPHQDTTATTTNNHSKRSAPGGGSDPSSSTTAAGGEARLFERFPQDFLASTDLKDSEEQRIKTTWTTALVATTPLSQATQVDSGNRLRTLFLRLIPALVPSAPAAAADLLVDLWPEHVEDACASLPGGTDVLYAFVSHIFVRSGLLSVTPSGDIDWSAFANTHAPNGFHKFNGMNGKEAVLVSQQTTTVTATISSPPTPSRIPINYSPAVNFNPTPEVYLTFLTLLVKFHPAAVSLFLSATISSAAYSIDAALKIVSRGSGVADATALLLEHTGDTNGAMGILLKALKDGMLSLESTLFKAALSASPATLNATLESCESALAGGGGGGVAGSSSESGNTAGGKGSSPSKSSIGGGGGGGGSTPSSSLGLFVLTPLHASPIAQPAACHFGDMLGAVMNFASRSSLKLQGSGEEEEGQKLWLSILDLLVSKQRDAKAPNTGGGGKAAVVAATGTTTGSSAKTRDKTLISTAPIPHARADSAGPSSGSNMVTLVPSLAFLASLGHAVRRLLSAMKTSVPLNFVLSRVLKDHSSAELGEFRETISSMLAMLDHERRMLNTALSLLSEDVYRACTKLHNISSAGRLLDSKEAVILMSSSLQQQQQLAPPARGGDADEGEQGLPLSLASPTEDDAVFAERLLRFRTSKAAARKTTLEADLSLSGGGVGKIGIQLMTSPPASRKVQEGSRRERYPKLATPFVRASLDEPIF